VIDLSRVLYCPVVSTRDAEFRGFSELSKSTLSHLLPVVELTRSRRSKLNANGDIHRSLERLLEVVGNLPFIMDVSSSESQQNSQTAELLSPENGFEAWCKFVASNVPSAIPVVHFLDPFDEGNFLVQLERLGKVSGLVALRIPTWFDDFPALMSALSTSSIQCDFILLLDAAFVRGEAEANAALTRMLEMYEVLRSQTSVRFVSTLASAFPSSVVDPGYGGDEHGILPLHEVMISRKFAEKIPATQDGPKVLYGDYSCIHPLDFQGTVTNWVPRVDCPLDEIVFYRRYRRHEGGYVRAAKAVADDAMYRPLECWGCEQISAAARNDPQGRSPSFWISVRLNIHIERQVVRLLPG